MKLLYAVACNDFRFAFSYDASQITRTYAIPGTGESALRNFSLLPVTDLDKLSAMPPVLFLNGTKDYVLTDSTKTSLREALPEGSEDVLIEGAGHMVIETHAGEVAAITDGFISAQSAG